MEKQMHSLLKGTVVFAALITAVPAFAQYRHDPGAVAGAVVGGVLGGGYGYDPGYGYGGYGSGYYESDPGYYGSGPAYAGPGYEGRIVAVGRDNGSNGDGVAYCEQRFRSYDPSSETYLGYDGLRHSCP